MDILAFETCFDACSVCVARRDGSAYSELASLIEHFETGHAERLVPMIDAAMSQAGLAFDRLDRIAVTTGPGTFTGTRIGIAAARGLALATGVPVVGVSSLAVMAEVAAAQLGTPAGGRGLAVFVDARRGEVYAQLFDAGGRVAKSAPSLLTIEAAARLGETPLLMVGSGAEIVGAACAKAGRHVATALPDLLPTAAALARMAIDPAPADEPLRPLYLRPPDAKPQDGKSIARAP